MIWEVIHNPAHYVEGRKIEPIRVIEEHGLGHHLACAVKYIARAGRKKSFENDLHKAVWYLRRAEGLNDFLRLTVDGGQDVPDVEDIILDWELSTDLADALRVILSFNDARVSSLIPATIYIQKAIFQKKKEEFMKYKFALSAAAILAVTVLMMEPSFGVGIEALKEPIKELKSQVFSSWMVPVKILGVAAAGAISFYKQSLTPFGLGIGTVLGISFFDSYLGDAAQGALI